MDIKKNIVPIIILGLFVIAGGVALWFTKAPSTATPIETATTTPSEATTSTSGAQPGTTGTAPIVTQTVWKTIGNDLWKIHLSVQPSWKTAPIMTAGNELSQISIGGGVANYFVSRNIKIAEPSKATFTTITRTIAGKSVPVHYFKNPSEGYAAYEYFSITAGNDTYYFQIKEKVADSKEVENFLSLIAIN